MTRDVAAKKGQRWQLLLNTNGINVSPLPFRVKEGKVGYYRSYVDLYWGDGEFLDAILRYTRVVQDVARWRRYVGGKGVHVLYACALIIIGI